jgi:hypothetical protein
LDTMNATTNHVTFMAVIARTIAATAKAKP